jgi:hypothetical protein
MRFGRFANVRVKYLSLEAMKEELGFRDLSMFPGSSLDRRPRRGSRMGFAWVARLVAQAREAGCKVHLKPTCSG